MQQNRSRKLMVSLCGLALSSVFLINNKSVVHADTIRDDQNNAISWNSDSDVSQGVQNTQKADDDQQNVQSVQPSRAETSTVSSVSVAPRTTNQNTAVQSPRVANVQDAQKTNPVVINNPANNKVHVHYIDANGNAVDNSGHDYDIDATKTGQGSYTVPNGYNLNVPDGKYNVNGGKFSATNFYATINSHVDHIKGTSTGEEEVEVDKEHDGSGSDVVPDPTDSEVEQALSTSATSKPGFKITYINVVDRVEAGGIDSSGLGVVEFTCDVTYEYDKYTNVTTYVQHLPVAFVDSNNNIVGMVQNYSGKVGTTQNVNLTVPTGYKLADGASLPTSVTFQNSTNPLLVKVVPSGKSQSITNPANNTINVKFVDQTTGAQVVTDTIDLTKAQSGTNYYNVPKGYGAVNNSYQVGTTGYSWKETENLWTNTTGKTSGTFKADDDGLLYTYKMFGVDPNKELKVKYASADRDYVEANGKAYALEDYHDALPDNLQVTASEYQKLVDFWFGFGFKPMDSYPTYFTFTPSHGLTDAYNTISGNTVTVPVHKTNSFSFADNSGNVQSVNGNTVDVTLTKPQSVNPATDTRCQSQATRTIQINFPDGQVPKSYDGIVDKSGKLVQTVHFTRTATEDALTGNILQYGNWTSDNQDHNFLGFPERTLPRIPGFTLNIKLA